MAYANLITLFQSIADKIRSKTGKTDAIVANNFPESVEEVFEAGKKSEYDAFWDAYQDNGKRIDYDTAFAGVAWDDSLFKPKYRLDDTITCSAYMMFRKANISDVTILGSIKSDRTAYMFHDSQIQHIGRLYILDTHLNATFMNNWKLKSIELLDLQNLEVIIDPFTNCSHLESIVFGGLITVSLNMQWSPLSVDSMKSAITHLKDYSSDDAKKHQYTLSFSADCWAALEADSASPDGGTWKEYVFDLGWNTN